MAETTVPSVEGRDRRVVATILIASGAASGALAGLVSALALGPMLTRLADVVEPGVESSAIVVALVGLGVALDAARLLAGRPGPPTAGRQVPREWARLLPLPVAAGLYGARLGVGPLTILSTWTWWSFTVAAALLGPIAGAAAGAVFGLVKLSVIAAVSQLAGPIGHDVTFGRLRAERRRSWATLTAATAAIALVASACGSPAEEASSAGVSQASPADDPADGRPTPERLFGREPIEADDHTAADDTDDTDDTDLTERPTGLIEPADLEDVVRVPATETDIDTEVAAAAADGLAPPEPAAVAADGPIGQDLLLTIAGYEPIDEPDADRSLDLQAAAEIQPDPTEEVALLETRGFRGGWLRAFRNEHNDVAVASVYEFRDETEAEFYLEDGLITIGGYGGTFFDIPDLPGVRGFAQEIAGDGEASPDLVSLGASFHRGDRWYLLYFLGSPDRVTPEVLVPAIAAQVEAVDA